MPIPDIASVARTCQVILSSDNGGEAFMARTTRKKDFSPIIRSAERWISRCLIEDGSLISSELLWTQELLAEVKRAFIDHPDNSDDDFMTKLKRQMKAASPSAQRLAAEMLWALFLFPSNMRASTKVQQIGDIWALSKSTLPENHAELSDDVLSGIGSGGPGFNNYRPAEMAFLIELVADLKRFDRERRRRIFADYGEFMNWISHAPQTGKRQFRHMLRFFAFPDRVERMSSNNDRRKILRAFGVAQGNMRDWTDRQFDDALLKLRRDNEAAHPGQTLDFYEPPLRERWHDADNVRTPEGNVTVIVPSDEEDDEEATSHISAETQPEARQSIRVQATLAEIGAIMGFSVWIPRNDRARVRELLPQNHRVSLMDELPLNYNKVTLETIEQIDVLWLTKRSIMRAFEVEHTTAVYSGLLRMADLLALQPNMRIKLHIVAPDERRDKVFREMHRPVFSLLESGPMSGTCSFLSYESVMAIRGLQHLAHTRDGVIVDYEERGDDADRTS